MVSSSSIAEWQPPLINKIKIDYSFNSESLFNTFWFWTNSEESVRFSPNRSCHAVPKVQELYANVNNADWNIVCQCSLLCVQRDFARFRDSSFLRMAQKIDKKICGKTFHPRCGFINTNISLPQEALQPPAHFQWRKNGKNADALCDGIAKIIEPF